MGNKNLSDMHAGDIAKCLRSHSMHLRVLSLAKNRLTDEGVGQVVRAICDTQIESLDLSGNKISEKSVDGIVGCLKTNKCLKLLDLSGNGIGSRLMKNKLKNALPHIEVVL
jgi:Ran GTPase-activating protein (RanGAP) involved in mRNA processing and transport